MRLKAEGVITQHLTVFDIDSFFMKVTLRSSRGVGCRVSRMVPGERQARYEGKWTDTVLAQS